MAHPPDRAEEHTPRSLRLLVFDRTDARLGWIWSAAARFAHALRRFDAACGAATWDEALHWLTTVGEGRGIREIQFWGHGKWGTVLIARRGLPLDHPGLPRLAMRMTGPDALLWLRSCETLGASKGRAYAGGLTEILGCAVAGHTYVIGPFQSGLHVLRPGETPDWPPDEGLARGTAAAPEKARISWPWEPHTITCLRMNLGGHFG